MTIRAGEAWIRETHVVSAELAPAPAASPGAPRRASARPRAAVSSPPSSAPNGVLAEDSTSDFRAAMSLLDAGENRRAAAGFASFVEAHPRDPRAEDAAYSLVIALQRSGSEDDAKRAAQDYLKRYPAGFRRAEVEKLSR